MGERPRRQWWSTDLVARATRRLSGSVTVTVAAAVGASPLLALVRTCSWRLRVSGCAARRRDDVLDARQERAHRRASCRWLVRQGVRVAPFKAQNMALNSATSPPTAPRSAGRRSDGRPRPRGVEAEAVMSNPVLLKPGSDAHSQVVLLGRPVAEVDALSYRDLKPRLFETAVLESLNSLRSRFDVVICEEAPAAPPRSTCAIATWRTWALRGRWTCRRLWLATSIAAACWRPCSARSRCLARGSGD